VTPGLVDRTDGELAALAIAGQQPAFAEIMQRHKGQLHRLAARMIGDDDEALDLVQETFVSAHQALKRYDPERPMRAWLARITINKCRDWRRRRAVRRLISFVLPIEHAVDTPDHAPMSDAVASDRQEMAQVADAIAMLPVNLRETLVLRTIDGMTQAETADVLGITEKTVETRLYRARARLAELTERTRGSA
jgi:RNA polymerase sigma-70 factor (ECF subfamily)